MSDEEKSVKIGDEEVSLASIAGLNMDEIPEVRMTNLPEGIFVFRVNDCKLDIRTTKKSGDTACIILSLEVADVKSTVDKKLDHNELLNKKHNETFFIKQAEDLGRFKALCVDVGLPCTGPLEDVMNNLKGLEFVGQMKHRNNPDDKDNPFANIRALKTGK